MRRNTLIIPIALLVLCVLAAPDTASAAETPAPGTTTPAAAATPPDPTYHYNGQTGQWENDTYSWNPATGQTTPKAAQNYSYNPATGMWDSKDWQYDDKNKAYAPNAAAPTAEAPTTSTETHPDKTNAAEVASEAPDDTDKSDSSSGNKDDNSLAAAKTTGPNASQHVKDDQTGRYVFANFYNASISNDIDSTAHTGDAVVDRNTVAGDATSGNAVVMANLINLLQSYWNGGGGDLTTFVADLHGDTVGDLYIDPRTLNQSQQNGLAAQDTDVQVQSQTNGLIDNTINLAASSGNAGVTNNTVGGSATSGDAHAVANVLNLINSIIAARQSFMGVVNIYGNLEGDILLPPEILEKLLASNGATPQPSSTGDVDLTASHNDTQTIHNNVHTAADTGNATVDRNGTAGDATTGDALTNVTILNLTGKRVVAKDTLLVFVNVLGKWVGLLMNAPEGSTAAALGGGVTEDTTLAGDVDLTTHSTINNDINVTAATGDATVANNTQAGNARTGNASARVNLANIIGSNISLSDWFGVLFINVFGNWNGSFGVNTPWGNPLLPASEQPGQPLVATFQFIPGGVGSSKQVYLHGMSNQSYTTPGQQAYDDEEITSAATSSENSVVLAAADNPVTKTPASLTSLVKNRRDWKLPIFGAAIGSLLLGGEQAAGYSARRRKRLSL